MGLGFIPHATQSSLSSWQDKSLWLAEVREGYATHFSLPTSQGGIGRPLLLSHISPSTLQPTYPLLLSSAQPAVLTAVVSLAHTVQILPTLRQRWLYPLGQSRWLTQLFFSQPTEPLLPIQAACPATAALSDSIPAQLVLPSHSLLSAQSTPLLT